MGKTVSIEGKFSFEQHYEEGDFKGKTPVKDFKKDLLDYTEYICNKYGITFQFDLKTITVEED